MTENCAVTVFGPDDPVEKAASAGRVREDMEVQIVDDDRRPLPVGELGEICIRPRERGSIMLGYYEMPAATVAATTDLWFHTGDRGRLDADGYLYFADRKKEAIRRRGENISAYEVETVLCRHPAVVEAAAVPVPSELGEDDVMAYVVAAPDAEIDHAELVRVLRRPHGVLHGAALPRRDRRAAQDAEREDREVQARRRPRGSGSASCGTGRRQASRCGGDRADGRRRAAWRAC